MSVSRLLLSLSLTAALCDFSSAVSIDTVLVGNPGNAADDTGYGSVDYMYCIGTYEVTNAQYVEFLNAADPAGANALALYSTSMSTDARGGINLNFGAADGFKYELKAGRGNQPVVYVSVFDSFRFANWLHNDQGSGSTESGAYALLGGTPIPSNITVIRNDAARWFLPSENEWYKAAYHKNDGITANYWDFPTATDTEPYSDQPPGSDAPTLSNTANFRKDDNVANEYDDGFAVTGSNEADLDQNYLTDVGAYTLSISPSGTFDQGGNVYELTDPLASVTSGIAPRGGSWVHSSLHLHASTRSSVLFTETGTIGFRIARLPLPDDFGDFNDDGNVDAADYVVWRKTGGTQDEFNTWRANFGTTIPGFGSTFASAIPEPSAKVPLFIVAASWIVLSWRCAVSRLRLRVERAQAPQWPSVGRDREMSG